MFVQEAGVRFVYFSVSTFLFLHKPGDENTSLLSSKIQMNLLTQFYVLSKYPDTQVLLLQDEVPLILKLRKPSV